MSKALDVKERTRSVNDKITYAAEVPFPVALLSVIIDCFGRLNLCCASFLQRWIYTRHIIILVLTNFSSLVLNSFYGVGDHCSHCRGGCHRMPRALCLIMYMAHNSNQALIRDGPELWEMLVGPEEDGRNPQTGAELTHSG